MYTIKINKFYLTLDNAPVFRLSFKILNSALMDKYHDILTSTFYGGMSYEAGEWNSCANGGSGPISFSITALGPQFLTFLSNQGYVESTDYTVDIGDEITTYTFTKISDDDKQMFECFSNLTLFGDITNFPTLTEDSNEYNIFNKYILGMDYESADVGVNLLCTVDYDSENAISEDNPFIVNIPNSGYPIKILYDEDKKITTLQIMLMYMDYSPTVVNNSVGGGIGGNYTENDYGYAPLSIQWLDGTTKNFIIKIKPIYTGAKAE